MFAYVFADLIGFMFFHFGYDWWRKQSKITAFIALVLVPTAIITYHAVVVFFFQKPEEDEEKES